MNSMDKNRTGLAVGAFLGLWHLAWTLLVALGWAQPLLDWVYNLHFMEVPHAVDKFNLATAAGLVAVAAVIGYVIGWVFASLWNALQKKS